MMNGSGQPSMPMHQGRGGQHDIPYSPQHHGPYPPQPYNPHPQHFRQPYYQQPPQQWAYYPNMQPMYRPFPHQHQAMMAAPYPMPQIPQSMSPRPGQNIPQHLPSRPPPALYSPPPPERPIQTMTPHTIPLAVPPPLVPPPPAPPTVPASGLQRRVPWYPPLPWYSDSSVSFPPSARKRKRNFAPQSPSIPVELPRRNANTQSDSRSISSEFRDTHVSELSATTPSSSLQPLEETGSLVESLPTTLEVFTTETPTTSQAPSENNSTQPTTPSSTQPPRSAGSSNTVRPAGKFLPVVPVVPHIPGLSKSQRKESISTIGDGATNLSPSENEMSLCITEEQHVGAVSQAQNVSPPVIRKTPPKSWADLVRSSTTSAQPKLPINATTDPTHINGTSELRQLADFLKNFSLTAGDDSKLSFIKPRGLKNTGNMCYMNSVLQVLLYCTPFYNLLDQVGKNAAHSFRSDTPMIEAMITFIGEFPVIDAAKTAEQLRLRLKSSELEQYGAPFTPEFFYDTIRRVPKFSSMKRGHQQDAEEFLGFLLQELDEECVRAIKGSSSFSSRQAPSSPTQASQSESGWLEVGPKQKAANTQSSGHVSLESPITKIFGGQLRSEFRVPGTKPSITMEPYQSLQLDIGSLEINNIVDALKGLTARETIKQGSGPHPTKQVFIETLPPVLILHLKRFHYNNSGGAQKIWKNVGYPQELEIPKEVFQPSKRAGFATPGSLPKYKLISVVYHHGNSASNGHYTVDVRRQDNREWIRLDDTFIQRVKSDDVAEPGNNEHPKILTAALDQHSRNQSSSNNIFDTVKEAEEGKSAEGSKHWNHVNGGSKHRRSRSRKLTEAVDGSSSSPHSSRSSSAASTSSRRTPTITSAAKDNKVAYILFYQRI